MSAIPEHVPTKRWMSALPIAEAKSKSLHLTYHPDAKDSPEWWGIDIGSVVELPSEETARFLAERINHCIRLTAS